MAPAFPLVLKLPRHEHGKDEPNFILVHVSSVGRHPLELAVVGTENSAVFALELKHGQTAALKAKNAPCSDSEWEEILSAVLGGTIGSTDLTKDLEAIAKVDLKAITITVQKRIEGITQRLGTLTLHANDDAEVDLYDWLGFTIQSRDTTAHLLQSISESLTTKDAQITQLSDSLAELVALKNSHENALLAKFALLLNEKKLKIRDQQRLLASANVDPEKLAAVEETRTAHLVGPSRARKRKAGKSKNAGVSDDDSESGFEKMDVDIDIIKDDKAMEDEDEDSEQEQAQTPDETTADEDTDSDHEATAPAPEKKGTRAALAKGKENRVLAPTTKGAAAGIVKAKASGPAEDEKPPPKRELPFATRKAAPKAPPPPVTDIGADAGSETESDDEL